MHIPDGFLSPPVWGTLDVLALPLVAWVAGRGVGASSSIGRAGAERLQASTSFKQTADKQTAKQTAKPSDADDRAANQAAWGDGVPHVCTAAVRTSHPPITHDQIPLMGVMGAFIFAAQMINFPVAAGTSGHLIGGTLLALVLGPGPAAIVLTSILVLQALIFQDGGVLALGANVFNMALAGVAAGYLPIRLWGRTPRALFMGGLFSVGVSALLALSELLISGIAAPRNMLWASLGVFLVNGLMEGAITIAAVRAIERLLPSGTAFREAMGGVPRGSRVLAAIGLAALLLGSVGIFLASAAPDGLQQLVRQVPADIPAWFHAPLAGYEFKVSEMPGWASGLSAALTTTWVSRSLAACAGVGMAFIACLAGGRLLTMRAAAKASEKAADASSSGG